MPTLPTWCGALVRGRFAALFQALHVIRRDAADIANHVRRDLAERIVPKQTSPQFNIREAIPLCSKAGDLFVGQAGAYRYGIEVLFFE